MRGGAVGFRVSPDMGRNYCADRVQVKASQKLNIGFVRRGFSPSGGAEAYLRRVAGALVAAGHEATLFTTKDWPEKECASGRIIRIGEEGPIAFADELERIDPRKNCDLLVSLERVWRCDCFRAGDGVHRAWLGRKAQFEATKTRNVRRFKPERDCLLRLETPLLHEVQARPFITTTALLGD